MKEGGGAPDLALQTYERTGTVIPGYHGLISEYSGKPINEEIARGGPFVMNTKAEILQAVQDYHNGTFVK